MLQGILIALLVLAAAWIALSRFRGSPRRTAGNGHPVARQSADAEADGDSHYPAVSIRTYHNGCPAAEALKGQRFLPEEAPSLPLPNCIWARCNCTYAHHVDRRTGNLDRRKMIGDDREYPLSMGDDDPRGDRGRRSRDGGLSRN